MNDDDKNHEPFNENFEEMKSPSYSPDRDSQLVELY